MGQPISSADPVILDLIKVLGLDSTTGLGLCKVQLTIESCKLVELHVEYEVQDTIFPNIVRELQKYHLVRIDGDAGSQG